MSDLSVQIGSLKFKNPVLTASGTFGYGTEYCDFYDVSRLGGIVTKTITPKPRVGNPMPRIAETPAGMLNSIGLANVGAERFIQEKLPLLRNLDTKVVVNVAGSTIDAYLDVVNMVHDHPRTDALEINISCPNVKQGGLAFGTDVKITGILISKIRKITTKPVIVKLTPNVTDIVSIAKAAADSGADALSMINTVLGMRLDIRTRRPLIAKRVAGLSGPAIKPIALAKIYQVLKKVKIPIIGIGGIMTWEDALEFLLVGATAVQIGTLSFIDPYGPIHIIEGLDRYCANEGIRSIKDVIGGMIDE